MTQQPEPQRPRIPGWIKKTVPALVSVVILYYCLRGLDWQKFLEACEHADLWLAVLAVVVPQLLFWWFTTLMVERCMNWFHGPFPLWDYFWVRGASNVLFFVNNALGGTSLLMYQQRRGKITWRKLMGMRLFRVGVGVGWGMMFIMIPATLAMHYYDLADKAQINLYVWWGILIFPGLIFFISTWHFWFNNSDWLGVGRLIVRDRASEFWTAFREAKRKHWFLTWAMVVPPILSTMVGYYFLNRAFNVNVPFFEFLVVAPVATLVMDMPLSFAGFGTATLAWMTFFGAYGSTADIAALTLFLPTSRLLCRALIGLISLKPAIRDVAKLFQPADTEPEAGV